MAAAMILVLVAIVMFAILFRVLGLASDEPPEMELPAPEWEEADVLDVVEDVAPELESLAVPAAPTFDDVLIEKIAAVDSAACGSRRAADLGRGRRDNEYCEPLSPRSGRP